MICRCKGDFFKVSLKFKMATMDQLYFFMGTFYLFFFNFKITFLCNLFRILSIYFFHKEHKLTEEEWNELLQWYYRVIQYVLLAVLYGLQNISDYLGGYLFCSFTF